MNDKDKKYIKTHLEFREENFAIKIEDNKTIIDDEKCVFITHNGSQWNGFYLTSNEARKLIIELEKFASPICTFCGISLSEHINQEGCIF